MCFGGGGGNSQPKEEPKPANPTLDPKFMSSGNRTNALYLSENAVPSIAPSLANGTAGKPRQGVQN